jgi:flavin reductase (DIM6/NTAB) family NADH-FMN oxidoreductase RutF
MSLHQRQAVQHSGHLHTTNLSLDPPVLTHDRPSVNDTTFRRALSQIAAGTNIVTLCSQDGSKLGLTATAVTSVSLDPPLMLVCVHNGTRSAAALKAHAPFVVHVLGAGQESLARHFASALPDKFAGIPHSVTASGCPLLEGVLASIECLPYQIYSGGDHTIVVGRVVEAQVSGDEMPPLIYFRRQFLNQEGTTV